MTKDLKASLQIIRRSYQPIQPSVGHDDKSIIYEETQPSHSIGHLVYCYWQLKTRVQLKEPYVYKVVSDGCIDILFNQNASSESFVVGFCRKYSEFEIGTNFHYIGIRFLPAAFPIIFGIDAKTLVEKTQELRSILPDWAIWIQDTLKPQRPYHETMSLLDSKLSKLVSEKALMIDPRFLESLSYILEKKGYLDTEKDLNTGVSPRQLRRLFNYYIGTTPKAFSNIVRFQHILNAKPSNQSLRENKIYLDVGFFDQAHFIKAFKTFYGVTPSEAFR